MGKGCNPAITGVTAMVRYKNLCGLNVRSLHTLGALSRFVGHFLTFLKGLEAARCDRRVMSKEICARPV
jgi:hypothetical protein